MVEDLVSMYEALSSILSSTIKMIKGAALEHRAGDRKVVMQPGRLCTTEEIEGDFLTGT